jgi:hypothetical protein
MAKVSAKSGLLENGLVDLKKFVVKEWVEVVFPKWTSKRPTFTIIASLDRHELSTDHTLTCSEGYASQFGPPWVAIEFEIPPDYRAYESPIKIRSRRQVVYQDLKNIKYHRAPELDRDVGAFNWRKERPAWLYRGKLVIGCGGGVEYLTDDEGSTHVRHAVLKEEKAFEKMKREVDQFKKFEKSSSVHRSVIPDDVKMFVWRRDEGRCVKCGGNENLEYDHIIPVSKGGSNTERNLQLLCEQCNREKGARIRQSGTIH